VGEPSPSLQDAVIDAVCAACSLTRIHVDPDARLTELGMDSVSMMAVVVHIEAAFGVTLPTESVLELLTASTVSQLEARLALVIEEQHATAQ
jgi:acyl carrier protein